MMKKHIPDITYACGVLIELLHNAVDELADKYIENSPLQNGESVFAEFEFKYDSRHRCCSLYVQRSNTDIYELILEVKNEHCGVRNYLVCKTPQSQVVVSRLRHVDGLSEELFKVIRRWKQEAEDGTKRKEII